MVPTTRVRYTTAPKSKAVFWTLKFEQYVNLYNSYVQKLGEMG